MALAKRKKLYVIPYAGGTTTAFRTLPDSMGPLALFTPLELPGRGLRIAEAPITTVDGMIEDIIKQMTVEADEANGGYYLFGHTMGARLAYLVSCRMRDLGKAEPLHLFLGGEGPPEICPWRSEATDLTRDSRFIAEVIGSGAHPEDLLRISDSVDRLMPALRADMEAFDHYDPPNPPKLSCPMTAIIATRDIVNREEAERWARRTAGKFEIKTVAGSHFFFVRQMPALGKALYEGILRTDAANDESRA